MERRKIRALKAKRKPRKKQKAIDKSKLNKDIIQ